MAYAQNLPLRIAGVRVFEARALLGIAVGEFYPQVQLGFGAATYNRLSERSPSAPQPGQPELELQPTLHRIAHIPTRFEDSARARNHFGHDLTPLRRQLCAPKARLAGAAGPTDLGRSVDAATSPVDVEVLQEIRQLERRTQAIG